MDYLPEDRDPEDSENPEIKELPEDAAQASSAAAAPLPESDTPSPCIPVYIPLCEATKFVTLSLEDGEELHDEAVIYKKFFLGKREVQLPCVATYTSRNGVTLLALVVGLVRHHRQKRNALWAFPCEICNSKLKVAAGASRVLLTSRQMSGIYQPCPSPFSDLVTSTVQALEQKQLKYTTIGVQRNKDRAAAAQEFAQPHWVVCVWSPGPSVDSNPVPPGKHHA